MTMQLSRHLIGVSLGLALCVGTGLAAEPADVETFVNARIEIGEMMANYFKGGESYGSGQRPSQEKMKEMGDDIHASSALLSKRGLTVEDYHAAGRVCRRGGGEQLPGGASGSQDAL